MPLAATRSMAAWLLGSVSAHQDAGEQRCGEHCHHGAGSGHHDRQRLQGGGGGDTSHDSTAQRSRNRDMQVQVI